ncbi:hypothetical protein LTR15_007237 [Elasticomyces elasticus]|nr:hypothetical protein LTR15_007237 [Elasticomyces elasticus]
MCFIDLEVTASVNDQADQVDPMEVTTTPSATELDHKSLPAASIAKRKATSTLEPEHNKKPKASGEHTSSEDEEDSEFDEADRSSETSSEVIEVSETTATRTRKDQALQTGALGTAKTKVRGAEVQALSPITQSRSSRAVGNKNVENSIKHEWKTKMDAQKDLYDAKLKSEKASYQARLDRKHALYQEKVDDLKGNHAESMKAKDEAVKKKLDDWRAKCRSMVETAKESEQAAKKELAEAKKEYAELGKHLKAEQQSEINKWKPEISPILKEKNSTINELRKVVANTQSEVTLCEQEIEKLEGRNETVEKVVEQLMAEKDALSTDVSAKEGYIATLLQHAKENRRRFEAKLESETAAWESKYEEEGKKWEKQVEKADNLGYKLTQQQRANTLLMGMNSSRDHRISSLETKVAEYEKTSTGHGKRIEALETGSGTSTSMTAPEEEGSASVEASDNKMKQELESVDTTSLEGSVAVFTSQGATKSMFGGGGEIHQVDEGDELAEKAALDGTNANLGMLEQATAAFTGLGEVEMVAEPSHDEAMA